MPLTTDDILIAWNSVTDRWISRRNKTYNDGRQYEVIHDWGGDAIGDGPMKVVGRYENHEHACERAIHLEGHARAQAVLDRINREERRPRMSTAEWTILAQGQHEDCASVSCDHAPALWRMDAGGTGSYFCEPCRRTIVGCPPERIALDRLADAMVDHVLNAT